MDFKIVTPAIRILFICFNSALLCKPAVAGSDTGLYIGGGVGDATISEGSFDESDTAYKLFGGLNLGLVPFLDLAAEISVVDFGSPSNSTTSVDLTGVDGFGLVGFSFGPFGVFGKAGVIRWSSDTKTGKQTISDSGTDAAYGIGARFAIGSFAVRAEYEVFNLDADVDMVSVSGVFTF